MTNNISKKKKLIGWHKLLSLVVAFNLVYSLVLPAILYPLPARATSPTVLAEMPKTDATIEKTAQEENVEDEKRSKLREAFDKALQSLKDAALQA
ncbi:MAG: hypothetical protein RB292_05235, partial [Patescibacteria group bacterium]|nr:hypothetical protein [Patescibacteria group bacterium]